MQNLYCLICGELTEAHDYADAIICDKCPVPIVEKINESQEDVHIRSKQDI